MSVGVSFPPLGGVVETMLWPLAKRARAARAEPEFLDDPMGVALAERLGGALDRFGGPDIWHAIRARYSDDLARAYLRRHPRARVVALGEGLETQFWRVDNGLARWISVDLPEAVAFRARLLPAHERVRVVAGSAFDDGWTRAVDASAGLFVVATGLLMYFRREDAVGLLRRVRTMLPPGARAEMFFDTISPFMSRVGAAGGWRVSRAYRAPPMPFGIEIGEVGSLLAQIPGARLIRAIPAAEAFPERTPVEAFWAAAPWVRRMMPGFVHLEIVGAASAPAH